MVAETANKLAEVSRTGIYKESNAGTAKAAEVYHGYDGLP